MQIDQYFQMLLLCEYVYISTTYKREMQYDRGAWNIFQYIWCCSHLFRMMVTKGVMKVFQVLASGLGKLHVNSICFLFQFFFSSGKFLYFVTSYFFNSIHMSLTHCSLFFRISSSCSVGYRFLMFISPDFRIQNNWHWLWPIMTIHVHSLVAPNY